MPNTIQYLVRSTPAQVIARVNTSVPREKSFGRYEAADQIVGETWGKSFDLRVWRGFSSKHNGLYLKGIAETDSEGCRLRTWYGFHPITKVFMSCWLAVTGFVWVVAMSQVLPSSAQLPI